MAHDCPECDRLCYCDGDDTFLGAPEDCTHIYSDDCPADDPEWEEYDPREGEPVADTEEHRRG